MRAQSNLPALAVALLVLTTTAGLAFSLADGAFAGGSREPTDRRLATGLAERMVASDSPLTRRAGVVNATKATELTASRIDDAVPAVSDAAVSVRLANRRVVHRGDTTGGSTARRVVLVAHREEVTSQPPLRHDRTTLPRRTEQIILDIDPPNETTVQTVRANGRVVLHEPSGLDGRYEFNASRFETPTLAFDSDGPLRQGNVTVTYVPERTTKATLEVTVDA